MINTIALKIKLAHKMATDAFVEDKTLYRELQEEYHKCLQNIKEEYKFDGNNAAKMFAVLVYKNLIRDSVITTTITKKEQ